MHLVYFEYHVPVVSIISAASLFVDFDDGLNGQMRPVHGRETPFRASLRTSFVPTMSPGSVNMSQAEASDAPSISMVSSTQSHVGGGSCEGT